MKKGEQWLAEPRMGIAASTPRRFRINEDFLIKAIDRRSLDFFGRKGEGFDSHHVKKGPVTLKIPGETRKRLSVVRNAAFPSNVQPKQTPADFLVR